MSSSQPPSGERNPLGFDELIAILVAFGTMGAILFWVTGRNPDRLNARNWQFPAVFSQPAVAPASPGILTPAPPSSDLREAKLSRRESPARAIVPSEPDTAPVAPLGPTIPPIPPMGTIVVPQKPIVRSSPPPLITKPKAAKPKVGPVKLSDVPDKYWARPFIVALVDRKIFDDLTDSKFRPDEPMTRAELARLIERMSDKEPIRKSVDFKDVKDKSPAKSAIDHSVKTGYLKGYPDNAFRPDKEVPRVEVIAALASGLNLKPSAKASKTLQVYTDRKKLPKWAVDKVAAATEAGIVVNHPKPTLLQPNRIATRAEVAAMIYQAMAKKGKVPAKASEYVVRL
ncbi:S-layer homology domain-containing protein [Microcoleus sp. herbarium14]|uniref:S-layer homology domain-containing protein n=1 Tax=Microcoleus sp. herbarium14 TaxID=3055439 RepID=UPI002FD6FA88